MSFALLATFVMSSAIDSADAEKIRTYGVQEAREAVFTDSKHFYVADHLTVSKYIKKSGAFVDGYSWQGMDRKVSLRGGFVRDGKVYLLSVPSESGSASIEILEQGSMKPTASVELNVGKPVRFFVPGDRADEFQIAAGDQDLTLANFRIERTGSGVSVTSFGQVSVIEKSLLASWNGQPAFAAARLKDGELLLSPAEGSNLLRLKLSDTLFSLAGQMDSDGSGRGFGVDADGTLWQIDRISTTVIQSRLKF